MMNREDVDKLEELLSRAVRGDWQWTEKPLSDEELREYAYPPCRIDGPGLSNWLGEFRSQYHDNAANAELVVTLKKFAPELLRVVKGELSRYETKVQVLKEALSRQIDASCKMSIAQFEDIGVRTQVWREYRDVVQKSRAVLAEIDESEKGSTMNDDDKSTKAGGVASDQPPPTHNDYPAIQDLVVADISERKRVGIARYGTPLQPHNGRDALVDLYQELLDACIYTRQMIYERDGE